MGIIAIITGIGLTATIIWGSMVNSIELPTEQDNKMIGGYEYDGKPIPPKDRVVKGFN